MARRRKAAEEPEHENMERWLVSYADMITLLAALFIVLFAMSSIDLAKFQKFAHALNSSLGGGGGAAASNVLPAGGKSAIQGGNGFFDGLSAGQQQEASQALLDKENAQKQAEATRKSLLETQSQIEAKLQAAGLGNSVHFRLDPRGLVINIVTDGVLFDSGSAQLRPDGQSVLDQLAPALNALPEPLSIEGHTDNVPIGPGGAYPSNWELSTARATSVLRYLIDSHGLNPARLTAAGYADQRPLVPNTDDAGRATNRRVEIVVIAPSASSASINP
ncbi:MAG TPA: flagellar motor protein MotB [Acidimicrobiia bacterium]|jgi:chemotaxis protein MotB